MQYLKDSQRIEDRSEGANGSGSSQALGSSDVNFESLVGGASTTKATSTVSDNDNKSWDDDVWGSILADTPVRVSVISQISVVSDLYPV